MSHNEHEQAIRNAHDKERSVGVPHDPEQAAQAVEESRDAQIEYAKEQFKALGMTDEEIEEELSDL